MSREKFIDSLRSASQVLRRPTVASGRGPQADADLAFMMDSADLWLTKKSVEGFDPTDFLDRPDLERESLADEVEAFLAIAELVPSNGPANRTQRTRARRHLEEAIRIVREPLLRDWLKAQDEMLAEAMSAAQSNGWGVEQDKKEVFESLFGSYKAPRIWIRSREKEVGLDPIARFGSGRQGVVDLVVKPTYETEYLITYKDTHWYIASAKGTVNRKPFTQRTFVNTVSNLFER